MPTIVDDFTALTNGQNTWNGKGVLGQSAIVTFSFDDVLADYAFTGDPDLAATWEPLSEAERALAREALAAFDSVCGITFIEVPSGQGDIRYGSIAQNPGVLAFAFVPQVRFEDFDIPSSVDNLADGDLFAMAAVDVYAGIFWHELGHSLGLSHPSDGELRWSAEQLQDPTQTVMISRADTIRSLSTFDIQALQYFYGTNEQDGSHVVSATWDAVNAVLTQTGFNTGQNMRGTNGADIILARGGSDVIRAESGNDSVDGGRGQDSISGDIGRDTLKGGAGVDVIYGHADDDVIVIDGADNAGETYDGGAGIDTFLFTGRSYRIDLRDDTVDEMDHMTFGAHRNSVDAIAIIRADQMSGDGWYLSVVNGTNRSEQLLIDLGGNTELYLDALILNRFDDAGDAVGVVGSSAANVILGSVVGDEISGENGNDTLNGFQGDDTVRGGRGADDLRGGTGSDTLEGGAGSDNFIFEAGFGRDTVLDFADNIDTLWLDQTLWGGGLTVEQVISAFGSAVASGVSFAFADGSTVLVNGLTSTAQLLDDISLI